MQNESVKKLVSVVVTCYNQEKFIEECLVSIREQTYKNIDLIICDDSSKDSSSAIISEWIKNNNSCFKNVQYIKNSENVGISKNHNIGLAKSIGQYITFIHGDDKLFSADTLEKIINYVESEKIEFCSAKIQPFLDKNNGIYENKEIIPNDRIMDYFRLEAEAQFDILSKFDFVPGVMLAKTDFLKKYGGFDEEFKMAEDWAIWLNLSNRGNKINCYESPLILYRRHPDSISESSIKEGSKNFTEYKIKVIDKYIIPNWKKLKISTRWTVFIRKLYFKNFLKYGANKKAHKKARYIRILDPFYTFSEIFKRTIK